MKKILHKLLPRKIPCSALDIGVGETKFVSLAPGGEKPVIMFTARYPTPPGFWTEIISRKLTGGNLAEMIVQHDLGGTEIISTIGNDSVVTRHISLPKAAPKELAKAVINEAQKVMPYDTDELVVRHIMLEERAAGNQNKVEILFAALPLSLSYQYHALLKHCGLALVALDLPAIALWRLFKNELAQSEAITAIMDIGETRTCLVIAKGQQLQYTRTMPVGGALLTGSMADGFGMSIEQARAMKEEQGIILDKGSLAGAEATALQIDLSLRDGLGQMIKEIRRSLEFYAARDYAAPVRQVILAGGTSKLKGFEQFIGEALDLPAKVVQPSSILFNASGELGYDPAMAVAYGLALREMPPDV